MKNLITNIALSILLCLAANLQSKAQCPPVGNLILSTQTQIDAFPANYPGCTILPAGVNLTIQDDNDGTDNITNLDSLYVLTSIGGDLDIDRNASFLSFMKTIVSSNHLIVIG